ncbi:MAG: HAD-IA family hydrolase [Thermodesulfobacteriota bacterium]
MKNVEFMIFDLDGTLIDSKVDIANALNLIMEEFGYGPFSLKEVVSFIGGGVRNLIRKAMGTQRRELEDRAYDAFLEYYSNHLLDNTILYPSVKDLLKSLNGKKKAVITNKPEDLSIRVLDGLNIRSHFSLVLGGDSLKLKKPFPEPLLKAMMEVNAESEKTIMIGDSPIDIEAGKRAGVATCGVTYGYSSREELEEAGADIVIDNLIDLKKVVF